MLIVDIHRLYPLTSLLTHTTRHAQSQNTLPTLCMPCCSTVTSSHRGITHLKMSPLVPIRELDRVPLGKCSTNDRCLFPCQSPTVARSHHQHPCYWVDGKTVVGAATGV